MIDIKYTIEGISPLLMHRFSEETYKESKNETKNMSPREIAERYAYKLDSGELYIPGEAIYAALREAGRFYKLGKKSITTNNSTLLPAGCIMITEKAGLGTNQFEVDARSAVNNAIGARIMSYRPRLDKWKTSFVLSIDPKVFELKLIDQIIKDAGSKCGLLSFRPLKKGWFGRFILIGKEELTN